MILYYYQQETNTMVMANLIQGTTGITPYHDQSCKKNIFFITPERIGTKIWWKKTCELGQTSKPLQIA